MNGLSPDKKFAAVHLTAETGGELQFAFSTINDGKAESQDTLRYRKHSICDTI
jgi:hypothetical protein